MAPERYPVGTKIVLVAARYNPHLVGALGRVADEFGYRICTDGSEHIGYVIELFDWPSPTELGLWSVAQYQIRPLNLSGARSPVASEKGHHLSGEETSQVTTTELPACTIPPQKVEGGVNANADPDNQRAEFNAKGCAPPSSERVPGTLAGCFPK